MLAQQERRPHVDGLMSVPTVAGFALHRASLKIEAELISTSSEPNCPTMPATSSSNPAPGRGQSSPQWRADPARGSARRLPVPALRAMVVHHHVPPRSASASAIARPSRTPAPVTSATRPSRSMASPYILSDLLFYYTTTCPRGDLALRLRCLRHRIGAASMARQATGVMTETVRPRIVLSRCIEVDSAAGMACASRRKS